MNQALILTEEKEYFSGILKNVQDMNNFEVHIFDNSLELINYFLTNYAQLVILDLDLLQNETFEMVQILRSLHSNSKIVLFLSPIYMPICSETLSLGVLSYQVKPVPQERTLEIISSALHINFDHH
jgi:response regulator of citrate/malate metabolism